MEMLPATPVKSKGPDADGFALKMLGTIAFTHTHTLPLCMSLVIPATPVSIQVKRKVSRRRCGADTLSLPSTRTRLGITRSISPQRISPPWKRSRTAFSSDDDGDLHMADKTDMLILQATSSSLQILHCDINNEGRTTSMSVTESAPLDVYYTV